MQDFSGNLLNSSGAIPTEAEYRTLLNDLPIAIQQCDAKGNITYANRRYEELVGYAAGDAIKHTIFDRLPDEKSREELENYLAYLALEQPPPERVLNRNITASGQVIDLQISWDYTRNGKGQVIGFSSVLEDVTEKNRLTNELVEYQKAVEASGDLIAIVGCDYHYKMANRTYLNYYSKRKEEVIGYSVEVVLGSELFNSALKSYLERCFRGETIHFDRTVEGASNCLRHLDVNYYPRKNDQGENEALVVIKDITERKQQEQILAARLTLTEVAYQGSVEELLRTMLDTVESLTASKVSCLHFLDVEKKQSRSLKMWSTKTIQQQTTSGDAEKPCPLEDAGIWAKALKQKKPLVHKDPLGLSLCRWLPADSSGTHSLLVPVLQGEGVVALLILAKPNDYDQACIKLVSELADLAWDIIARKQAEESLREKEVLLRKSQEIAHIGSWQFDLPTGQLIWSEETYRIFGFHPNQHEPSYELFLQALHPEDRQVVDKAYSSSVKEKAEGYEIEHRIVPSDSGAIRFVREECRHLRDSSGNIIRSIGTVQDITERKKNEIFLDEQRSLLRAIYEGIPDVIVTADTERRIISTNAAMKSTFGYTEAELLGKKTALLYAEENSYQKQGQKRFNARAPQIADPYLVTYRRKDGSTFPGETIGVPIHSRAGEIIGYIGIIRDVTTRIAEEQRSIQSQKIEAVGMLAGGVAHDFNNILSPIITYATLLEKRLEKGSKPHGMVLAISDSAIRAADLVKQILVFSRHGDSQNIPIHINLIIKEVLNLVRASTPSHVQIHTDIPRSLPTIFGDPTKVHQILINLCTNSFHAIGDEQGEIQIKLAAEADDIVLTVSDTGPGIPPEVLARIFDPYFTTKDTGVGTGLGMYIVKKIVDSMEGKISIKSSLGEGTQITIHWPAYIGDATQDQEKIIDFPRGEGRIALVDDEKSVIAAEKIFLESLGYNVSSFSSSEEARDCLLKDPQDFDLLITDLGMPKLSGFDLSRQLRRERIDIPIILCSGRADLAGKSIVDELGIFAVLSKPDHLNDMATVVKQAISIRTDTE